MIEIGKLYTFDTEGNDSEWKYRDGAVCIVIRPLTEKEADLFETGPMYRIEFIDGTQTDAFEDELKELR